MAESEFWPDSLFGLPMPWGKKNDSTLTTNNEPKAAEEQEPTDPASHPTNKPEEVTPAPLKRGESVDEELMLLRLEQYSRLKEKGQTLYTQSVALHRKIADIDTLSSLLTQYMQQNPDGSKNSSGSVDCTIPDIAKIVTTLRAEGIKVPLPNGKVEKSQMGSIINALTNQRSLLSDEQRGAMQELSQCQAEQNNLYQALISIISGLNRVVVQIGNNISKAAAH
jgi:ribulose bisphosphate carboxylase small subunit